MKLNTVSVFFLFSFFLNGQSIANPLYIEKADVGEKNQVIVIDAESNLLDFIHETDFYEFESNEMIYYVADVDNRDLDDKYLIRTTKDFSKDILLSDYSLDYSKRMIEIQYYNSTKNVFNQYFRYISDDEFNNIRNRSIVLDKEDEDIRIEILSSFQYQFDYLKNKFKENTSKRPKRVPQIGQAFNSDTDQQAKLDNYISTNGSYTKTNTLYVNRETKNTIDDSIVSLIPKQYFTTTCTKTNFGTEWGYYIDTYSISSYGVYTSEVFIFDVNIVPGDEKNYELITLTPVVNATYIYYKESDIVSYYQKNTFCIMKPQYASNIRYVSDYVMTFNDYDETEYVPINEHPLNPDENGYTAELDNGMFFGSNGFVAEAAKEYNIKGKVKECLIDASKSILLDLIPNSLVSAVVGKVIDGIGLLFEKIYEKIKNESSSDLFDVNKYKCEEKKQKGRYIYSYYKGVDINFINATECRREHKFNCFDLSNDENFKLTNTNDYISFFSKIELGEKYVSSSYKALISHGIGFDLCKMRVGGVSRINHFFNNIGYLYQPGYQSSNQTISNHYLAKQIDIHLDQSNKMQETKINIEENGTYLFDFSKLASGVHIYFSSGESFDSGELNEPLISSSGIKTGDITLPTNERIVVSKKMQQGNQLSIKFLRYFENSYKERGYYSTNIFMFVYKLEDNSMTNFSNNVSSLDNTFNTYVTSSIYKTIKVNPQMTGFYTFYMNDESGRTLFSITDSIGRILYDAISPVSSQRALLNLKGNEIYYIHFVSYQTAHKVTFCVDKNKYIYSTIGSDYDFNYQQNVSSDITYLFNPSKDTKLNLSVPLNADLVTFSIYDEKRNLLKKINNPIGFDYSFIAKNQYYLQMKYSTSNSTILISHCLRIRRIN